MTLNPVLDPFVKGLKADLETSVDVPKGYRLATGPEVGIHYDTGHPMNFKRLWLKPTTDTAGIAAWEKEASPEAQYERRFTDACRNAVWAARLNPDKGEGLALFEQYHSKGKPLPPHLQAELDGTETLPPALVEAMRKQGPQPSFTSTPLASALTDKKTVSGVRLEKPDLPTRRITR